MKSQTKRDRRRRRLKETRSIDVSSNERVGMIEKMNFVHSVAGATERTGEGRWGPRDLGTERNGPRSRLSSSPLPPSSLPTVLSRHQSRRAKERMVFIEWRTE